MVGIRGHGVQSDGNEGDLENGLNRRYKKRSRCWEITVGRSWEGIPV